MQLSTDPQAIAPVSQTERILVLDSLRGIALLGILMMNIPFFGLPGDPAVMDELGTINFKVWYVVDGYLDGTQRALFLYAVWVWHLCFHFPFGKTR
jgi:uncharacterized membrane protein YeiB